MAGGDRGDLTPAAAGRLMEAAKRAGWLEGEWMTVPELAEDEKNLFITMLRATPAYLRSEGRAELTVDEIAAMFHFVYAKAAEAVSAWLADQKFEVSTTGLFDGDVPLYADERLVELFRNCPMPETLARAFLAEPVNAPEPLLVLFEALKLAWRLACHWALRCLEELGLIG